MRVDENFRIKERIFDYNYNEETNQRTNKKNVEHEFFYEIATDLQSKLQREEREDLFSLLGDVKACLKEALKPQGFNIGINIGKAAGAGIPEHLHIHIVPRWMGDSNFMPVTAGTKVISQSLNRLYTLLKDAYEKRIRRARK